MKKEDNLKELEEYSIWLKVNRQLEGPLFIISLAYMLFYAIALILWVLKPELLDPYSIYMGIGFVFFVFTLYVVFTGLLLKDIT